MTNNKCEHLISIIIPVYNVERYLHECLNSIVAQSYKNIEIILIDDGSPDGCPAICDEYSKKDDRIKVIHKQNEGPNLARKSGIDVANGELVTFVDSDDWLEPNYVEYLYKLLKSDDVDISCCNCFFEYKDGDRTVSQVREQHIIGLQVIDKLLTSLNTSCWGKLYSREALKKCSFKDTLFYHEDLYTNLQIALTCKGMAVSNKPLYHYRKCRSGLFNSFKKSEAKEQCIEFVNEYIRNLIIQKSCDADAGNLRIANHVLLHLIDISCLKRFDDYYKSYVVFLRKNAKHLLGLKKGLDVRSRALLYTFLAPAKLPTKLAARLLNKMQLFQNKKKYD